MRLFYIIVVLVCIGFPWSVSAEFYKYVDKNGVTRFTDNLAEVPRDQRPKIKRYSEQKDFMTAEELAEKARKEAEARETAEEASDDQETPEEATATQAQNKAENERLQKVQESLNKEYAGLMKEKEALAETRAAAKTDKQIEAYNQEAKALNEKISDYEKRRQAFDREADAFYQQQGK